MVNSIVPRPLPSSVSRTVRTPPATAPLFTGWSCAVRAAETAGAAECPGSEACAVGTACEGGEALAQPASTATTDIPKRAPAARFIYAFLRQGAAPVNSTRPPCNFRSEREPGQCRNAG